MPIYEFKCQDCDEYMEILVMNKQDEVEMVCSKCGSGNLERILSSTNHAIAGGGGGQPTQSGVSSQTRTCSSGSCTTYTIPGPA
ncbi:zinc ribbon domain-containing protein [uncultured Desulfosarcina sp.]|uniref:FmdB family zinc ribbon protein n=1 Tax=uncultured Desulfosarcina sp. TaxID=218289 RepID=UPI0029C956AE|nr:zinc ribbon domain-containing protein [uncultured Desulfosarcina sp.]